MTPDRTDVTALLIAVRDKRDRASFAALFDCFAPRLKGMLRRSGMSGAQAEDIIQETMLTVWQKAAQFDAAKGTAASWIYCIARSRLIDQTRREKYPLPEPEMAGPETEDDAEGATALAQEAARLRDALRQLPQDQRDMVERAYFGELTHKEITTITGLPLGTIKSRIRLALERLRHEMRDLAP